MAEHVRSFKMEHSNSGFLIYRIIRVWEARRDSAKHKMFITKMAINQGFGLEFLSLPPTPL